MKTYMITFTYEFEVEEINEKKAMHFARELPHGAHMEEHPYDRIEIKEVGNKDALRREIR